MSDMESLLEGKDAETDDTAKVEPSEATPEAKSEETPEVNADDGEAATGDGPGGEKPESEEAVNASKDEAAGEKSAPKVHQEKDTRTAPITALLDERDKRQAAEKRLRELEASQATQSERPDPIADPDGAKSFDDAAMEARLFNERCNMSETIHRGSVGNEAVDAALVEFEAAAKANPALRAELQNQPDPYGFVLRVAKERKILSNVTDLDEYRKTVRAEVEAELKREAEAKAKAEAAEKTRSELPESLAGESSVAKRSSAAFTGPTPMEDILDN